MSDIGAEQDEHNEIPYLRFSREAQLLSDMWRQELEQRLRFGSETPTVEAHLAKYRSLVPSLALLIHLVDGGPGPVTVYALEKAIGWAAYLESHARRVYAAGNNPGMTEARELLKHVMAGDLPDPFKARDAYRPQWAYLADSEMVKRAIDILAEYGWLRREQNMTLGHSSRLQVIYHIHPKTVRI